MAHVPPVARLALAFASGVAWILAGLPSWPAPIVGFFTSLLPIGVSRRPILRGGWTVVFVAGSVAASGETRASGAECTPSDSGSPGRVIGRFLASPRAGSAPFERLAGCGTITVVVDAPGTPAGRTVEVRGSWREGARGPWFLGQTVSGVAGDNDQSLRWQAVRWRDGLARRIDRIYEERAPLVAALTLARREGFDPELRATFARTGLAHLLAISGFHVGVIAGMALALLRLARLERKKAGLVAAAAAWIYVGLIGFPDAACRAALILAFGALAAARGRPAARWGALGSAGLVLLSLDPERLASPGFQLSFAGAAGLVAWSTSWTRALRKVSRNRIPEGLAGGIAAGVAATLATLPIVAWHFEQVSIVGVPGTLVAGPLVAVALPGAILSVLLDFMSPNLSGFVAGGVDLLLFALERGATALGSLPGAAIWISRPSVWAMGAGVVLAMVSARRPAVGRRSRRAMIAAYVSTCVIGWPLLVTWTARGTVEVVVIDVGQGDAVALRGTNGRWILIDAGPPGRDPDPEAHPVVRALRARGIRRLEALVLTHADLDHIGGARAVLESLEVGVVYDPGIPAGKEAFVDLLEVAGGRSVPWREARAGDRLHLGELELEVVSPTDSLVDAGVEANEASVVAVARYGAFEALLTGDAYKERERALAGTLDPDFEILKVGHHGSETSTDPLLLERLRPQAALVSAGRSNRYGHPDPRVLERLRAEGIEIRRTDLEGTLEVVARPDGRFEVRARGRR